MSSWPAEIIGRKQLFTLVMLSNRFNETMTKYGGTCRRAGQAFVPLVVETLGGWEEVAEK